MFIKKRQTLLPPACGDKIYILCYESEHVFYTNFNVAFLFIKISFES